MSSLRQIEANRRNAGLSTGPVTDDGKERSRRNAVRHGLTAETVITTLEDAEDYEAFQMTVTADYDPQSAVERELVLRLASLLWRLRRASTIETGLFDLEAGQLLQFRKRRGGRRERLAIVAGSRRYVVGVDDEDREASNDQSHDKRGSEPSCAIELADKSNEVTRAFVRLNDLPTCPLDRLSRYEAALWRQACQIMFTLQCMNRPQKWGRLRCPVYR
jgi:hypothetical protein